MEKNYNILVFLLVIIAGLCLIYNKELSETFSGQRNPQPEPVPIAQEVQTSSYKPIDTTSEINIPVNRPTPLGGKSKAEIYKIRKGYVENSIFKNQNYEPSDDVFGQIVDYKPWISTYICHEKDTPYSVKGPSEETRFINNPTVLIGIEYPFGFHDVTDDSFCDTDLSNILPQTVTYNGKTKEITVEYRFLPFTTKGNHTFYTFNGINARDFGYKYVYFDKSKSTYDIEFSKQTNISTDVYEIYNFIHLGYSCDVKGGCNNGSPRQDFLEFRKDNEHPEQDKVIYLKLWKNRPQTPKQEADIIEKIIFRG